MSFSALGLRAELLLAVAEQGYTEPTPIQTQAIPAVLAGGDLLAGAQTGTGKTAGFTLPILQRLSTQPGGANGRTPVRALILAPTRELAAQVAESVRVYGKHLPSPVVVGFRRRRLSSAGASVEARHRHPGRHAGPAARPPRAAHRGFVQGAGAGARRGRPHARHGLHSRHHARSSRPCPSSARTCCFRPRSPTRSRSSPTASCATRC